MRSSAHVNRKFRMQSQPYQLAPLLLQFFTAFFFFCLIFSLLVGQILTDASRQHVPRQQPSSDQNCGRRETSKSLSTRRQGSLWEPSGCPTREHSGLRLASTQVGQPSAVIRPPTGHPKGGHARELIGAADSALGNRL